MSPERWERIQKILQSAMTLTGEMRTHFLDQECVHEIELRQEVESLLSAGRSADCFFQAAIGNAAALLYPEAEFPGDERFTVLRRLGSGGFGVVYQVYDQRRETVVALKTLRQAGPGALL